jgi:vancomycin permeability regulator SanA
MVNTMKKKILKIVCILVCIGLLGGLTVLGINGIVKGTTKKQILSPEEAAKLTDVDCILVLGCGVRADGSPSDMLRDRLLRAMEVYELGGSAKLLMTGDHGRENYDEVAVMKSFAVDAGVPSEDVFMDHAGFSTYESMYRAKEIFQAKKVIIITQEYHLYRALFIANRLGLESYGVSADYRSYTGQAGQNFREFLARVKDFATSLFQPEPTYLGETIPISGNGDLTNDDTSDFS